MQSSGFDFQQNHFQLFGFEQSFRLDSAALESRYRALQSEVHPDKAAQLGESAQRIAMQQSTRVNEAYQTLKSPLRRARYLVSLHGVDTQEETNTAMPVDFLMAQMELREAVEAAVSERDIGALEGLEAHMKAETRQLEAQLAVKIDTEQDYAAAAGLVRKLRFMEKLAEELHSAYDEIDS
ncbi:MAG: Fe-S protein assembly co-chaperone HscB [Gallionella sp.]|nr:Fe-S protein assembly co-chaperone HscB [Gallionella sp.]MDD4946400.1 Fe-S protein assembly co-chaperone HscB [Gallionella sp.]MDD5612841.1 Fe-S protein assembly co-chaperone HscB [Gallionella sp.]